VKPPRLLLITDPSHAEAHVERVVQRVGAALLPGAFGALVRDKERPPEVVRAFAARLRAITSSCGAALVVHSDAALARDVSADGLHLGGKPGQGGTLGVAEARRASPATWISVAAHDDDGVRSAVASGADAVLVSPIYATPGKGPARGPAALESARALGPRLVVYALGGVDASCAKECRAAGADGIALIRALLDAHDPAAVARAIDAALR